jgi:hypothetical protein
MTMQDVYDSSKRLNDALRELDEKYQRGEVQRVELPRTLNEGDLVLAPEIDAFLDAREKDRKATANVSVGEY